jgi:hypothetical protein
MLSIRGKQQLRRNTGRVAAQLVGDLGCRDLGSPNTHLELDAWQGAHIGGLDQPMPAISHRKTRGQGSDRPMAALMMKWKRLTLDARA